MKNSVIDKRKVFILCILLMVFAVNADTCFAANALGGETARINLSVVYGITAMASFLIAASYFALIKQKDVWLMLLFVAVFAVNMGYFSLSMSKNLEEALLANRLAYFGSCFLPLCMLMAIRQVCGFKDKKWIIGMLVTFSICVFVITASPGYTTWYYADVELVFVHGMAKLVKCYGPLHNVYYLYLISYFTAMVVSIVYAYKKHVSGVCKHAVLLTTIVFLNIVIWLVEQLVELDFEVLAVSYIVSEILLLLLYWFVQDYKKEETAESLVNSKVAAIDAFVENVEEVKTLTSREQEILIAILNNKRRKHIADELSVSENTVKKHTNHIYSKLGITTRDELLEKLKEYE